MYFKRYNVTQTYFQQFQFNLKILRTLICNIPRTYKCPVS